MKAILTLVLALTDLVTLVLQESAKPNMVLMLAETVGYNDISACDLDIRDGLLKFNIR